MAPNTSRDHPDDLNIRQRWPNTTIPFPPYRGPQAQPHRRGTIVAHVCLRLSVASRLSHSYRMELFVNCVIYNVMSYRVVLCYVTLRYVTLRYVTLRYVTLRYAMLCYVMLCYVMFMLCYVMLCYVMLCYVMLCYVMLCYVMLCYVMLCYVMLCYAMHEQEGVTWEFFPPKKLPPPHRKFTIWQTFPRKKSHGRTSTGEKQYHNYGKASPSMVDHPPPPHTHTFLDKGRNTMADCPLGNYTMWQTFPMKEYLMANLPPEEIP